MDRSIGLQRFEFFLSKLEVLVLQSEKEKNPALYLYTNNARTPLFMLEGLAKLYAGIHNKHRFEKLENYFKTPEDALGAIDYYDSFAKEFAGNPMVPAGVTEYLGAEAREKIQRLNDILEENKWIGNHADRIKKIRKKLSGADWKPPKEDVKGIFDFYKVSAGKIKEFMSAHENGFTEIENQVHAMRRKLRWLSIYPQALQGVIQLRDSIVTDEKLSKYLIPEIVNSPFNKMPAAGNNTYFLIFEKNYFLALSWLIAELGKLKDNGLRILATTEALQQSERLDHQEAFEKSCIIFGTDNKALANILANATLICKDFFTEKNLDKLIYGVTSDKTKL